MASLFRIVPAGQDAFRRSLPLESAKLETNEEFLVIRAKIRPVLLIRPECPWPGVAPQGYRGRVQRHLCTVAPIFGLADPKTGQEQFPPSFIGRVRKMEFPELMFLPKKPGFLEVDSLLRLDELQSVFTAHLDPRQLALGDEVLEVLRGQLQVLFCGPTSNKYTELRELLLNE